MQATRRMQRTIFAFILVFVLGSARLGHLGVVYATTSNNSTPTVNVDAAALRKELALVLPRVLENPSYKVVFKNPSKEPIELSIDGKTYKNVKSPFTLPNLSVGKHTLVFKYTNKQGVLKILSTDILVVPRKPIIDSKQRKLFENPEPVIISGSAIPNGSVLMIIDGKTIRQIEVDSSGAWVVKLEHLKAGKHTFMFLAMLDGIVNPTPVTFDVEYKDKSVVSVTPQVANRHSGLKERLQKGIIELYTEYKDLLVYIIGAILAIIFTLFLLLIRKHIKQKEQEKTLAELLNLDDADIVDVLEQNKIREKQSNKSGRKVTSSIKGTVKKEVGKTVKEVQKAKQKNSAQGKKKQVGSKVKEIQASNKTKSKKTSKPSDVSDPAEDLVELKTAKSIHVQKIKVALPNKGKKVLSKEEFLKRFGRRKSS